MPPDTGWDQEMRRRSALAGSKRGRLGKSFGNVASAHTVERSNGVDVELAAHGGLWSSSTMGP